MGDNADAFPNDATETLDTDGDGMGDNEQAVLEAKLAKEEEEAAAAAQRNLLIGIGLAMIAITAAVVVVLRKRMADGDEGAAKDFGATELPGGMPDMSAQPAQSYGATAIAMPDMTAQPVATPAVVEPEPVAVPAEPTVVNQWTDENGHTWRVMSDGTNRWWNGTDWQQV